MQFPPLLLAVWLIEQQPRAFWSNERGTNIRIYKHFYCNVAFAELCVWHVASPGFGPYGPQKGPKKWARSNILGTTWNLFYMNKPITLSIEWTMPDKLVAGMGVPDAPKGHPTFRLDQTLEVPRETISKWRYHMKPIPNEYLCPSEYGMNNIRQISHYNGVSRRPQRTPHI